MKKILLLLCLLLNFKAMSSHIVGGELELQHIEGYTYRISLIMYVDLINGNPNTIDSQVSIRIFDKRLNAPVTDVILPRRGFSSVDYTDIACTTGELQTRRRVYYQDFIFSPEVFNSPDGYYMTYERCCRNRTISNIINAEYAGQAFYLEFPAVSINNTPFVNSSPRLFPPLSDYACVNELFYYDFSGTDDDGDSLVYDIVTPLNGFSDGGRNSSPVAGPAPYPEVMWLPGYNRANQIPGSPPLAINAHTGRLTVRPRSVGLFVFGVRIQEYRNGRKIGEVRRDFQLLVKDCPRNESPIVMAKVNGQKSSYKQGDILRIKPGESSCLNVVFTDPDPNSVLTFYTQAVNFSSNSYSISGTTTGLVNGPAASDSLRATLCFNECFDTNGQVYKLNLIVKDNACSLPRLDTLEVSFIIDPVQNEAPSITISRPERVIEVMEGDQIDFNVLGFDPDNDEVTITALGKNFDLHSMPIRFESRTGIGQVASPFSWQIDCAALALPSYLIEFTATSLICGEPISRTELVEVRTNYPNQAPVFTTDKEALAFDLDLNKRFEVNLKGLDHDMHLLSMVATIDGYTLEDMGMTFNSTSGAGYADGKFTLTANCKIFEQEVVRVTFHLKEEACAPSPDQTITMEFKVKAPDYRDFTPPNIFTPNGDGLNDFFEIPGMPADVCTSSFQNISIFNRWGKEVWMSKEHNFKWDGKDVSEGVYFYVIDYGSGKYKGSITLMR